MTLNPAPEAMSDALSSVPVFPLPGVVFFPEQRLPLHIFEPRYRAMVRDVLDTSSRLLVVSRIEGDPHEPEVRFAGVATVGRVVGHQRLPDGRFNILLEGVSRVSLAEHLPQVPPYRRAHATPLPEPHELPATVPPAERSSLLAVMSLAMRAARARQAQFDFHPPLELSTSRLAMRLVERFVTDPSTRQSMLECDSARGRVALATRALLEVGVADKHPPSAGQG